MMKIPVNYRDFSDTIEGCPGSNGNIIKNAKTHGAVSGCMMTWRTHRGKSISSLALH